MASITPAADCCATQLSTKIRAAAAAETEFFPRGCSIVQATESAQRAAVLVSGVRLSVQSLGSGTPVLYLHGAAGMAGLPPYLVALAERHTLTVPDHPGFGASQDPAWIRTVDDIAMLYLDYLETLPAPVHVVAHSLGGWIAAEMAIRNCTRMKSLSLIAPAGLRVKGVPIADNFIWSPEENARALFVDQALSEKMLAAQSSETELDIAIRNRFTVAKLAWKPRWYDPTLEKWLHRIRVPVNVIWGDSDRVIPPEYARHWASSLPDARVDTIPAASHLPQIECAEKTAVVTLAFLKDHDA